MYRIVFNAKLGAWLIQVCRFYILWESIKEDGEAMKWANFDAAAKHVKAIGLDKAYLNHADSYPQGHALPQYITYSNPAMAWKSSRD